MTSNDNNHKPRGFGLVLIIIAVGLAVSLFQSLSSFGLAFHIVFSEQAWSIITATGSGAHQWLWKPVLITDLLFHVVFFSLMLAQLIQFFFKLKNFSVWFIRSSFLLLLFFIWTITTTQILVPETVIYDRSTLIQATSIGARFFALIPYLLLSRRVKNTFIY